ncbi:MAG: repeat containing protein [Cyanobacteria bacterium RYN_339]|nr:repeat containing protein [Cyanobacteria bacterium RYN_339]
MDEVPPRLLPRLVLAAALLASCKQTIVNRPIPRGSAGSVVDVTRQLTTLTGKVKIISDNGGGIISDNGGGIISDNGGGIISNNSGSIISNNSSSIVANNGAGLTSKVKRQVLATAAREYLLADAVITVQDAAGKPVLDAAGKPLTAVTDATGSYKLSGALPAGNLVLKIKVHDGGALAGGELAAMLPKGAKTAPIDTSSSLGAAYVLGKYVKGSQQTYDKLPAAEADKLQASLDANRKLLTAAPKYQQEDLTALTESLRGQAKDLDQTLTEIQALLIGQANGGDGQQALNAALAIPTGLALQADGTLLVGEPVLGRIRSIGPDGKIGTLADTIRGQVKQNFAKVSDLLTAPDGSTYVATHFKVTKIAPDGQVTAIAGTATAGSGPVDVAATSTPMAPACLALGPDGTLYIGESRTAHGDGQPGRLLAVDPAGQVHRVDRPDDFLPDEEVAGLAQEADGTFDLLLWTHQGASQRLVRLRPGQPVQEVTKFLQPTSRPGDLARAADGTFYVSIPDAGVVEAVKPDGSHRVAVGIGGPATTADLGRPGTLAIGPDGTLLIADLRSNLVRALAPTGAWTVRAGTTSLVQANGDLSSLALNGPFGATFDDQGRLLVAEAAGNRITRFDGKTLEVVAGDGETGFAGDGGPALQARFTRLNRLAYRDGTTYALDDIRLRAIGPDGTIRTVAGGGGKQDLAEGERLPASQTQLNGNGLAIAPDGRIYIGTARNQIVRIEPDGTATHIAGVARDTSLSGAGGLGAVLGNDGGDGGPAAKATIYTPHALAFDAKGDLYVADAGGFRIRKITGLDGTTPIISTFAGIPLSQLLALAGTAPPGEPQLNGAQASNFVFFAPLALTIDPKGNVFVADVGTVAAPYFMILVDTGVGAIFDALPRVYAHVYRISPAGTITVVAGTQGKFNTQPTGEDAMVLPIDLAIGKDGRLAIVDAGANLLRILPAGSY